MSKSRLSLGPDDPNLVIDYSIQQRLMDMLAIRNIDCDRDGCALVLRKKTSFEMMMMLLVAVLMVAKI